MTESAAPAVTRGPRGYAAALAIAAVCWGAFALGGARPWGYFPLAALSVAAGMAGIRASTRQDGATRPMMAGLAAVAAAIVVQLVPLPLAWVERVSPHALPLVANTDFAFGAGLVRFHALSVDPAATSLALLLYSCFAALLLGLIRVFAVDRLRPTIESLTIVGVLLALAGIVQQPLYAGRVLGVWEPEAAGSPFGPFVNKNHFAGWMLMALPLTVALLCAGLQQGMRGLRPGLRYKVLWLSSPEANRLILLGTAAVLMATSLVFTMSRSGMSALAMSLVVTGWLVVRGFDGRHRRAAIVVYLAVLALTAVGWVGADAVVERFSRANWSEFNDRRGAWLDALRVSSAFRLTGTGMNTYGVAARFYQQHDLAQYFREAHSDYLQFAAEGGLLVVVPAAVCVLLFIREVHRRGRKDQVSATAWWLRRGAVTGLLAIAVQESVEFSLQMPGNAVLFAVLCAIALHHPRDSRDEGHVPSPAPEKPKLRIVGTREYGVPFRGPA
jgi:O-antigen ligase